MSQKIVWTICLITGINIVLVLNSCGKKMDELPIKNAKYVYYNRLLESVVLNIINGNKSLQVVIAPQDSTIFIQEGQSPNPFHGKSSDNIVGDTVIINFNKSICTVYNKDFTSGTYGGNGVFNLLEYDNYNQDLVSQKSFTLRYSIDSTDYKRAAVCKQ